LFKDLTVRDIWPRGRELLLLKENEKVGDCLEKLDALQILSAPVLNSSGDLIGVIDVLDILYFVIEMFPKDIPLADLSPEDMKKVVESGSRFHNSTLKELIGTSGVQPGNRHLFSVNRGSKIESVLELFYQGIHRVVVLGSDGKTPINIISQSDMLHILTQCLPYLDENVRTQTIERLHMVKSEPSDLNIATTNMKAIEVVQKLNPRDNIPHSAVPIVSPDGKLIANFSASNLRGINKNTFVSLLSPVLDFLSIMSDTGRFTSIIEKRKALYPLHCSRYTSFENVVIKMIAYHIHRLWVVENDKPVGVISIGDLFKIFIPWSTPSQ